MAEQSRSVLEGLRKTAGFLPRRRRTQGALVLVLMLLGALAELVTIGSVLPFLALVADPAALDHHPALARMLSHIGIRAGPDAIVGVALLFCGVAVVAAVVRIVLAWASQKLVFRIGYDLGVSLYRRLLYQPYSFHMAHNSSSLLSSMNKIQNIMTGMFIPVLQGITAIVISVFILGGLIAVNAKIALASVAGFGLIYVGVSFATRTRLRRNSQIIAQSGMMRLKAVQEGFGGIRDVLIDSSQRIHIDKFARIDTGLRDAQAANALIAAVPRFAVEGLGMIMIVLLALVLSRQSGGLASTLPVLGALVLGAQRMLPLLQQSYSGYASLMGNRALLFVVLDLLEEPLPQSYALRHQAKPMPFVRDIVVDHAGFRYLDGAPEVLRDIALTISKGSRVGFIGKTGSGKSTLTDLIMGLLEPSTGHIRIDGLPLDTDNVASWQAQLAHVPQHIFLADGSFIENVAFGVPRKDIDEERVRDACRKADIHDFIETQRDGYEHRVGERGVRLSGGQRQRIGIARALYKQATVLILDEATSALDDATEASVVQAVERLGRELTVVMVAHRLTTLRGCDMIYRLDQGRIVEHGAYQTVIGMADKDSDPRPGTAPAGLASA